MKRWKIDIWIVRGVWALMVALVIFLIVNAIREERAVAQRNRIPDHFLGDVGGVPLLVPDWYLESGPIRDGHWDLVRLFFDLPDLGPGGRKADDEWRIGRPRLLSVRLMDAPKGLLEADMTRAEYHVISRLNSLELRKVLDGKSPAVRAFDFEGLWETFRRNNQHRDYELLDVGNILDWNAEQTHARSGDTITQVMFAKERIVLFGRCDKPMPNTSPHCYLTYHEPQAPIEMEVSFNRIHQDQTLAIIHKAQQRLREFNRAARDQGHPGPAWPPPIE